MFRRIAAAGSVALVLGATTGCAVNQAQSTLMAGADLGKVKSIYVVHEEGDDHAVDLELKKAFEKRGYTVATGPALKPPYEQDAVVTYVDKWMWDITMYMLQLNVTMRDSKEFPLATAHSVHTSLTRKSQPEMVDEVVTNVLAAKN
ncbi:MAG TPA: hypothetical protein VF453_05700 [Burkholderiaceae bacterium]